MFIRGSVTLTDSEVFSNVAIDGTGIHTDDIEPATDDVRIATGRGEVLLVFKILFVPVVVRLRGFASSETLDAFVNLSEDLAVRSHFLV